MTDDKKFGGIPLELKSAAASPRIYTNNVQVSASNWDVTFYFGEIVAEPGAAPTAITVESRAVVIMSHQHARAFAEALTTTLRQMDEAIGQQTTGTAVGKH